jgi:hypothetical protein
MMKTMRHKSMSPFHYSYYSWHFPEGDTNQTTSIYCCDANQAMFKSKLIPS